MNPEQGQKPQGFPYSVAHSIYPGPSHSLKILQLPETVKFAGDQVLRHIIGNILYPNQVWACQSVTKARNLISLNMILFECQINSHVFLLCVTELISDLSFKAKCLQHRHIKRYNKEWHFGDSVHRALFKHTVGDIAWPQVHRDRFFKQMVLELDLKN